MLREQVSDAEDSIWKMLCGVPENYSSKLRYQSPVSTQSLLPFDVELDAQRKHVFQRAWCEC